MTTKAVPKFASLHNHSCYSIRDGAGKVSEYVDHVKSMGQTSLALTEHGNMFSSIDFYFKAKKAGINPVLGCEVYIVKDRFVKGEAKKEEKAKSEKRAHHLTLLCKTTEGYKNLLEIVSKANLEGFYYTSRADKALLRQYSKGLVALSGCLGGELSQAILHDDFDLAEALIEEHIDIFGKENYFIEVMNHGMEEQAKVNPILEKMARKYGLKIVATNDAHYCKKGDKFVQDALLALADHKLLSDEKARSYPSDNFYLKSADEMLELFPNNPEYLQNAHDLAESCQVEIETKSAIFPSTYPTQKEKEEALLVKCRAGFAKLLGLKLTPEQKKEYGERVKYELDVINKNGFTDYFIIISDITDEAHRRGIAMSDGRGSVGGSLVAFLLEITTIDPIEYGLYFERFLNPERISPPDIDLDFDAARREEIIEYVKDKHGRDKICKMITFGKYGCKQALRAAFKLHGYDMAIQSLHAKMIPDVIQGVPDILFKHVYGQEPGYEDAMVLELMEAKLKYPEVFELAERLEGVVSNAGTHACSYVLTDKPLTHYMPLDYDTNSSMERTGIDMYSIEKLGVLKMDFLAIETLGVIEDVIQLIKDKTGTLIDKRDIPMDDEQTWKLVSEGDTIGIFQFESDGMRSLLKRAKPVTINQLADCNAIFRPGAALFINDYVAVKGGFKQAEAFHPLMEPVLKETYGVLIYQESIMKMCEVLAGFTRAEADYMRKAIGKKKKEDMDKLKPKFAKGCQAQGIDEATIEKTLDWFSAMSRYNFNKSHAVGYSKNAYFSSYFKAHYPLEFCVSFMNKDVADMNEYNTRVMDAKKRGLAVLAPDVNTSQNKASIDNGSIRLGLSMIKSVNENSLQEIMKEREANGIFTDYGNFINRTAKFIDKRALVGLASANALSSLGVQRRWVIDNVEIQLKELRKALKKAEKKGTPFTLEGIEAFVQTPVEDYKREETIRLEREYLGLVISDSEAAKYKHLVKLDGFYNSNQLSRVPEGDNAMFLGVVETVRETQDKNGNKMAFIDASDETGKIRAIVFSSKYIRFKSKLKQDKVVVFDGTVSKGAILVNNIDYPDKY